VRVSELYLDNGVISYRNDGI